MKLPAEKRDRIMVFVLIGVGSAAVLYASAQLVLRPFIGRWSQARTDQLEIAEKIAKAESELTGISRRRTEYEAVTSRVALVARDHVLQPILGTYLLRVREMLDSYAAGCSVKIESIREVGVLQVGEKRDGFPRVFKAYGALITGTGSYDGLCRLIQKIEESNPYVCIGNIQITSQTDDREMHRIAFSAEWPIWKDMEAPIGSETPSEAPKSAAPQAPAEEATDEAS